MDSEELFDSENMWCVNYCSCGLKTSLEKLKTEDLCTSLKESEHDKKIREEIRQEIEMRKQREFEIEEKTIRILPDGVYSQADRKKVIAIYLWKRKQIRTFGYEKIKYHSRSNYARIRPRVGGRFVDDEEYVRYQIEQNQKLEKKYRKRTMRLRQPKIRHSKKQFSDKRSEYAKKRPRIGGRFVKDNGFLLLKYKRP